jgi:hypothetical protein
MARLPKKAAERFAAFLVTNLPEPIPRLAERQRHGLPL